ncbi:hypothetical protein [Thermogymnomonas acidicola]|uniref:hypothetical protein n=1 Tax=Thermogymnomonas acidicola TaxID=399579 RepID=UPI0009466BBD|nr:hypothetical protein [Thermogymnomonas acidicola]
MEIISSSGGHYLWSTPDAIYYIARSRISIEPEKVAESLAEYISGQMMEIADSIEFTDRRINIPGKQMVYITEEVLREVAGKPEKLKQALRPEDKPVPQDAMEALARYRDVVNREFKGDLEVSLTPRGSKPLSYRNLTEGVSDLISDTEKMKKVILIRIVQLIGSQVREGEFEKVKELLDSLCSLEGGNAVINALLRETKEVNKRKNPLLIPLVVALSGLDGKAVAAEIGIPDDLAVQASGIDWHALAAEVSRELSSETSETGFKDNLLKIVRIILGPSSVDLPDVPDKRNMSMIDGYPGETEAIKENLYGLRTNAIFTNRVVTSAIQNSLVDGRYVLESFLRKKLGLGESREGSVFVFFDFPGPIPFFDLYRILNYLASNQKAENWAAERIDEIVVSLRRRKGPLRQDTSYFLAVDQPETTSDALRLYEEAIRLASGTKLRVQVIDSHSPPALQQREIFNYAVNNFVLDELGISRVRYNKLQEVLAFLEDIGFLANISRSSSKNRYDQEAEILREFIREPISLFSYCMDAVRSQENRGGESGRGGSSSRRFRFPPHLKAKVELYAERGGFGGVKGGVSVESVKKLARIARELWPPRFDMSGSQRSWMLRESLDVLEKALSETVVGAKEKVDLGNYLEFVEGHLYKGLQAERDKPDSKHYVRLDSEKIREFSRTFLEMIEKDFHGRPPTGNMKSYLIDAFEFEYVMGE